MKQQQPISSSGTTFSFGHLYRKDQLKQLLTIDQIHLPSAIKIMSRIVSITLILVVAAMWLPWVQTTAGSGQVTTLHPSDRVQNVSALVSGRIAQWFVQDADFIRAGDPIVLIEDLDKQLLPRLKAQLEAAKRKYSAAEQAKATAELDYQRQLKLFEEGLSARLEVERARIKVQKHSVALEEATTELNQAETNVSRQGSQLVRAPRDGTILNVQAGHTATIVKAGQALASFMPANAKRVVEIYIDGRDIGLVHPGRDVRLQFEGWPAFQFSGRPDLAVGTFKGEVIFVEPSARTDGTFRVLVKEPTHSDDCLKAEVRDGIPHTGECAWPPESFVRIGAKVRGWVLLETVSLGFELWRIMNNFPPVSAPISKYRVGD